MIVKVDSTHYQKSDHVTFTDKVLSHFLLRFFPKRIKPNHITLFRFATIPFIIFFLFNNNFVLALTLFLISAFSDALDGAMARTRNQITDWGKLYDPLADKLLIGSVAVILITKFINFYIALGIIAIELLLIGHAYYKKKYKNVVLQAHLTGKIKMILQSIGVILIFLYAVFGGDYLLILAEYLLYLAIIFAAISFLVYKSV